MQDQVHYLNRTHPVVEGLASYVMDLALDAQLESVARRCGAIRTGQVARRTTVLLVRMRYHIITQQGKEERELLAEDCQVLAFSGSPTNPEWISDQPPIEGLLRARPEGNILPEQAKHLLRQILQNMHLLHTHLDQVAKARGQELLEAHRRVCTASQTRGIRYQVKEQLPVDVLGIYVYVPKV